MGKTKITKEEAVLQMKHLFGYENDDSRRVMVSENGGVTTFMVNKEYMTRLDVVSRLRDFFSDKVIDGGLCRIDNMTLVYTIVTIDDLVDYKNI